MDDLRLDFLDHINKHKMKWAVVKSLPARGWRLFLTTNTTVPAFNTIREAIDHAMQEENYGGFDATQADD